MACETYTVMELPTSIKLAEVWNCMDCSKWKIGVKVCGTRDKGSNKHNGDDAPWSSHAMLDYFISYFR